MAGKSQTRQPLGRIAARKFMFTGEASTALHEATKALARLAEDPPQLARLGAVAQNLLRSESVASSRIEGVRRQEAWLERLGQPRKGATVRQLVDVLPEQPVVDVPVAQRLTGRSHVAVGGAIKQLEESGVLVRINQRKWGRVWECPEVPELIDAFEKSVSTG